MFMFESEMSGKIMGPQIKYLPNKKLDPQIFILSNLKPVDLS